MTHHDPNRPAHDVRTDDPHVHDPRTPDPRTNDPLNAPQPVVHDSAPVVSEGEARQGGKGRQVLYVLLAGLFLAMVAWGVAGFYPVGGTNVAEVETRDVTDSTPQSVGGIPLRPPRDAPLGEATDGQTAPGSPGRGQISAPSPTSDSAR